MDSTISVIDVSSRQSLDDRLRALTAGGPFRAGDLTPVGVNAWTFRLHPARPDMVIGFGKVAEFLVLLAREFEVEAVGRSRSTTVSAAS